MDELSILKEKFSESDTVLVSLFDVKIIQPEWVKDEKILAITQNSEEVALFLLSSANRPLNTFSDLSIEHIIPLEKGVKCEIFDSDNNKIHLTIVSSKSKFTFEVESNVKSSTFVNLLYWAIETADKYDNLTFEWLKKYYNPRDSDLTDDSPGILVPRDSMHEGHVLAEREVRIKYEMLLREQKFTYTKTITIFTGTWNVNEQYPVPLNQWLQVQGEPPDIYAIGFQELQPLTETREYLWFDQVVSSLPERGKYAKVDRYRLLGIMLLVFIKKTLYPHVKNIVSTSVGTGLMGRWGNKGGVSIRFDLHNTSICFVNAHLAAHVEQFERRNQDYRDICERTKFYFANDVPRRIKDHDQIYWIGDLNYRITDLDPDIVKECLKHNEFECVLKYDQLRKQHKERVVFNEFKEGAITFQPTYKYDPGSDNWDSSEKCRAPAWCDRILWRGKQIAQLTYQSHPELNASDHKPVSAMFKSELSVIDPDKYQKVYEEVIKKLDKLENELIPQVTVDQYQINVGTVNYLEPVRRTFTVANIGQVAAQFEFIKKLQDASFCKPWLTVEPYTKCISPGESCDINLEVFVNKNHAYKFNSGEDKMEDILILHLVGGKDIFISIDGVYQMTCFGCSMEALVQIREPIRNIAAKIIQLESKRKSISPTDCYAIPKEIWFLINHLCVNGLKEPNLFMQPGLHSEVLEIRDWLDNSCTYNISVGIHSYTEALLLLLESAEDPLIPYNLHTACLNASTNSIQCKQIINNLPELRRNIFYYLCEFLREVIKYNESNGIDVKTLCTLFGAIFLRELPNRLAQQRSKETKQYLDKLKANFVFHFVADNRHD